MAIIFANVGEVVLLKWMLKDTSISENLTMKLYSNNYTPVASSTAANFTESSFSGYSAKTLSRGSWSDPTTVSGKAESSYASQVYSATGSATVYGYFIVGASSGTLILGERFPVTRVLTSGDTVTIIPKITSNSEN